mmetsp:Transcript_6233/g.8190  ORF Transcript_6233/g.8190 Transcript_6233/m.8190 type:complete len:514 (-) Transcript_6233:23-1564(-)
MSSVPSGNGGEARNKLRAIVVGGSIGGLATAAVLNNQGGWEVKVYEKSSGDLSQRGAGIFTTRPMLAYLQKLGILSEGDDIDMGRVGVPLDERWLLDREGEKIYTYAGISQISGSWSTVYSHCRASMNPENYHQGVEVESYRESEEGVEVIFKDNARRPERCDVLVGADGSSSKIRSLLIDEIARKLDPLTTENVLGRMEVDRNLQDIFLAVDSTGTVVKNARGEGSDGATTRENSGNHNFIELKQQLLKKLESSRRPNFANYVAYRFVLPEKSVVAINPHWFHTFCFWASRDEIFVLCYPMVGYEKNTQAGDRLWNTVCYVKPTKEQQRTIRDASSAALAVDNATLQSLRSTLEKFLPTELVKLYLGDLSQKMCHPVSEFHMPLATNCSRVVLIGDAATTHRPHPAVGTTKAIEDAIALGRCLQGKTFPRPPATTLQPAVVHTDTIAAGLLQYNNERVPKQRLAYEHGRTVGACLFGDRADNVEELDLALLKKAVRLTARYSDDVKCEIESN